MYFLQLNQQCIVILFWILKNHYNHIHINLTMDFLPHCLIDLVFISIEFSFQSIFNYHSGKTHTNNIILKMTQNIWFLKICQHKSFIQSNLTPKWFFFVIFNVKTFISPFSRPTELMTKIVVHLECEYAYRPAEIDHFGTSIAPTYY